MRSLNFEWSPDMYREPFGFDSDIWVLPWHWHMEGTDGTKRDGAMKSHMHQWGSRIVFKRLVCLLTISALF